ncbi:pentatricopeptide repeat-containing protein [Tanacetum coccineum]
MLVLSNLEHPARLLLIQLIDNKLPVLVVNDGTYDPKMKHVEIAKGFMEIYFAANLGDGVNGANGRLIDKVISEKGVFPSLNTCNFLMSGLVKVGRFRKSYELFDVLRKGVEPDVYLFTNAINGLCKDGKVKEGMGVLLEMEKSGVLPNVVTYNNVIHGFCKVGDLDGAFRVKDKMAEKGVSPSVVTYSVLINGLLKIEKYNEAGRVLSEMTDNWFVPNEVVYNTLINGYCKIGDMKKALDVRDDMLAKGLNPNSGFSYTNQMTEAEKLLEEMVSANLTINADGFSKEGKIEEAFRLFNDMSRRGVDLDEITYTSLVHGCSLKSAVKEQE